MSYEVWGEPDEAEGPLDRVEFQRERKPWKRDPADARWKMQVAINERLRANPMVVGSEGNAGSMSKDHSLRFMELNRLHNEIWRYRHGFYTTRRTPRPSQRFEALARLHRIAELIPYYDRPPLP